MGAETGTNNWTISNERERGWVREKEKERERERVRRREREKGRDRDRQRETEADKIGRASCRERV